MFNARFHKYKEDVHAKKNHATENHVRRGIAVFPMVLTSYWKVNFKNDDFTITSQD